MRQVLLAGALALGCSGGDDAPACTMGKLSGAWAAEYRETSGDCGPVPAEHFLMEPGDPPGLSADRCSLESERTYPTTDGQGTYTWLVVIRQHGPRDLSGTGYLTVEHPDGGCFSTYAITLTDL